MLRLELTNITPHDLDLEGGAIILGGNDDTSGDRKFFVGMLWNAVCDLLYGGIRAMEDAERWIFESDSMDAQSFDFFWDSLFETDAEVAKQALRQRLIERRNNAGENPRDGRRRRNTLLGDHDRVGRNTKNDPELAWYASLIFGTDDSRSRGELKRSGTRRYAKNKKRR